MRDSSKPNNKSQRMWLLGAIALFVISKGKTIFTLLKVSKFTAPIISMFVTIGAYAIIFPVQFAVGLVVMLLIHEIGHVIAAKHKGLPVSAPLFIPFLGALGGTHNDEETPAGCGDGSLYRVRRTDSGYSGCHRSIPVSDLYAI